MPTHSNPTLSHVAVGHPDFCLVSGDGALICCIVFGVFCCSTVVGVVTFNMRLQTCWMLCYGRLICTCTHHVAKKEGFIQEGAGWLS